jgi:hypothetical protein
VAAAVAVPTTVLGLRASASAGLALSGFLDHEGVALVLVAVHLVDGFFGVGRLEEVDEAVASLDGDFFDFAVWLEEVSQLVFGDVSWEFCYENLGIFGSHALFFCLFIWIFLLFIGYILNDI